MLGLFAVLIHSAKLNSNIIGIDTESMIHQGTNFYDGWLNTGRQGLVLLKFLLGNSLFQPYFAGMLTVLLFAAAVGAFCLVWDKAGGWSGGAGKSLWMWGLAGFLWISHPVMTEQFYFSL